MGLRIEDGGGSGSEQKVSSKGRGLVAAETSNRAAVVALEEERTFSVVFEDANAQAGEFLGYLKNTSATRNLVIDKIRVSAVNAATWKLWEVTGTASGSGTAPTPKNMNLGSGIAAEATAAMENVTGLTTDGNALEIVRNVAASAATLDIDDTIILGPDNAIGLEYDAGTTGGAASTWRFHYEDL